MKWEGNGRRRCRGEENVLSLVSDTIIEIQLKRNFTEKHGVGRLERGAGV